MATEEVSVPRNEAFVFIKPHAVNEQVIDLVKSELLAKGMNISSEGRITAAEIDENQFIDTHYYAIASKATLLKPNQLNVPEDKFEAKFGLSWEAALASGNVFNAMDGAARLGMDATELDSAWGKCKKAGNMIKFGGGFYCGKLTDANDVDCYLFNGFFMSMRLKYVADGAEIYYFTIDWDPSEMDWATFRGSALGPTDPSTAPTDSIRGNIYANWESLGLAAEPNTGDNGVHASASPFEGLAERMNWLNKSIADDNFGKALLDAGVSEAFLDAAKVDPQVALDKNGTMGSCFDALEDINADECMAKLVDLYNLNNQPELRNEAFVFIKPHAVNDNVIELVRNELRNKGLRISSEGKITAEEIDSNKFIDNHYYAIASKATILKPHQLNVPEDKFEEKFGLSWQDALASGNVYNAMDGAEVLGMDAIQLEQQWRVCKTQKVMIKFGGGFYCAKITQNEVDYYLFNGFFMSMRMKYVAPGAEIYYFTVDWDPSELSWEDFRGQALGPTDPSAGPTDSIRGMIYADWENLGLETQPNTGDNGVHASASPFEGLAERMNWLGRAIEDDVYGQALLNAGISLDFINTGKVDPQVIINTSGDMGSCFDALEDVNAAKCLEKMQKLYSYTQ